MSATATQLATTERKLESTELKLSATESGLSTTQRELKETERQLVSTRSEVAGLRDVMTEIKDRQLWDKRSVILFSILHLIEQRLRGRDPRYNAAEGVDEAGLIPIP